MLPDKKELIIKTAMQLFAEKGYEGTSIRDLATAAGVNIAMVNYYFGSKDKLFEAMVEQKSVFIREKLEEIASDNTTTAIEKIDLIIENYVFRFLSQPHYHRLIHQELMLKSREILHDKIISNFIKNTQIIIGIIKQGIRKKEFNKVDPELTFASIIGTINQIMLSKQMCITLINKEKDFDPYTNEDFRKRLLTHLKQIIHTHLLIK